jgi:AmmeMemoRadiSam system protein B
MTVRPPAVAGRFYPARGYQLARLVDGLLVAARSPLPDGELRAVVAPHAGYVYSGTVAATAFAAIRSRPRESRVVVLGPSHFVPLRHAAVTGADAWLTPLGAVPIDDELRDAAVAAGAVVDDEPHETDHALEVELPFLQRVVGERLRALPVAVGGRREAAALVAAVSDAALIVVSTDLSHYHDDATARSLDRRTADAVVALDAAAIGDDAACGADALRGLVAHARRAGWTATLLALDTSAAASRDTQRVVGYGAFAFAARRAAA